MTSPAEQMDVAVSPDTDRLALGNRADLTDLSFLEARSGTALFIANEKDVAH